MMLGSLGLTILIYYPLFGQGTMATRALAVVMGYCMLSAVLGLLLIAVSQRDARNKREIADQMAEARQTKHVREALKSEGIVEYSRRDAFFTATVMIPLPAETFA